VIGFCFISVQDDSMMSPIFDSNKKP